MNERKPQFHSLVAPQADVMLSATRMVRGRTRQNPRQPRRTQSIRAARGRTDRNKAPKYGSKLERRIERARLKRAR